MPANYSRLIDEILFSKPATNEDGIIGARYYNSHGYSFVRFPAIETISLRSVRYSEAQIEALNHPELLGPYERQVLAEAIYADHKFVILMGYEGSGKSSTVTTVFNHYRAHRLYTPNAVFRAKNQHRLRDRLITSKLSHVLTDLEKFWKDVDEIKKLSGSLREQTERLYSRWAAQLSLSMESAIGSPTMLDLIDVTLNMAEIEPELAAAHGLRHAIDDVSSHIGSLPRTPKPSKAIEEIRQRTRAAGAGFQLMFWYAIFETAQLIIGDRLFAIVDNLDPFSEDIQEIVHGRLIDISQSSSFKVIAPMRPATFQVVAYVSFGAWYAHCGPTAVDVIALRGLSFLAKPDMFATFRTFAVDLRTTALQRVAEFLLLVNEPYFLSMSPAQSITALSGESIRRAMDLCQDVFLDDNWRNFYAMPALPLFHQVLGELEWNTFLRRLSASIGDELADLVDEILTQQPDSALVEQRITGRLLQSVRAALSNATRAHGRLLSHPLAEIKRLINGTLGDEFRETLRDSVRLQNQVITAHSISDEYLRQRIKAAMPLLLREAFGIFSNTAFQHGREPVAGLLCDLIAEGMDATGSVRARPNGPALEQRTAVSAASTVPSSHSLMHAIFRSKHFCNVLQVAGEASDIKIFILYYLASFARYSCEPSELWRTLMSLKFDRENALTAINEMCTYQTRLLWVSHRAGYKTDAEFTGERYPIALSRAGWLYYEEIVTNPGCVGFMTSQRLPPQGDVGAYIAALLDTVHDISQNLANRVTAKIKSDRRIYYAASAGVDLLSRMAMRLPRIIGARVLSAAEKRAIEGWRELLEDSKRMLVKKFKYELLTPDVLRKIHASPRGWRARSYAELTGGLSAAFSALSGLVTEA